MSRSLTRATRQARLLSSRSWPRRLAVGGMLLGAIGVLSATVLYGQSSDQALFIDQTGKVGIGTNKPQETLDVGGNAHINGALSLSDALLFGAKTRQMLNLYSQTYGLGIQASTMYFRTDKNFAWYKGGKHADGQIDPSGGTVHMVLKDGHLGIGTAEPENAEGWGRVVDVVDPYNINVSMRATSRNIEGRLMIFQEVWGAPAGMAVGTKTAHSLSFATQAASRMTISPAGNVGIGTTDPGENKLKVIGTTTIEGDLWVTGTVWNKPRPDGWGWMRLTGDFNGFQAKWTSGQPSDGRLKTDVHPIPTALEKVSHLRGIIYRWNQEAFDYLTRGLTQTISAGPTATAEEHRQHLRAAREKIAAQHAGRQMGLIAQEVESVVPEVVTTDEAGYKAIKYPHLTALLIEAVKEQQALIAAQHADIARLQASNEALQAHVQELQAHSAAARVTQADLEDLRAQLAQLSAAVQRVTATRQASATEVGGVIMPRQ